MSTRNQIAKFFRDFQTAHYQLKDNGYGDFWEIPHRANTKYPLLWVSPQPVPIQDREVKHTYIIAIADRVEKGESNELEVESDTFQICQDLLAYLNDQESYDWLLEVDRNVEPFTEKWPDQVAGWLLTITLTVNNTLDQCAVPSSGVTPEPDPSDCSPSTLLVNGDDFTTISSGGEFDLVIKFENGTVAEGTKDGDEYILPNSGTCDPATAVIKDSAGTTLKTESINSGASENITINDSVALLKNSLNTTILTENIRAEATENIPIADVDYTDSDGSPASVPYGTSLVCTPSATPSGVSLQWPNGNQYTSYRTGDEGGRVQASYFNYTRPAYPEVTAELDYTLGDDYFWRLKTALRVGGTLNTLRFVDVDGVQAFGATDNKNKIVIDKLTGIGFYRVLNDLGGQMTWNNAIDGALTFSVVVEGVTYSDWYLVSLEELTMLTGHEWAKDGALNLEDPITNIDLVLYSGFEEVWTSTTQANSTGNAYTKGWNGSTFVRGVSKAISGLAIPFMVFNAKSLISA